MSQDLNLDEGYGQCVCGSAWFRLEQLDEIDEDDVGPAVCIDPDGGVTGYAGKLVCVECEVDWNPNMRFKRAKGHLRLVE